MGGHGPVVPPGYACGSFLVCVPNHSCVRFTVNTASLSSWLFTQVHCSLNGSLHKIPKSVSSWNTFEKFNVILVRSWRWSKFYCFRCDIWMSTVGFHDNDQLCVSMTTVSFHTVDFTTVSLFSKSGGLLLHAGDVMIRCRRHNVGVDDVWQEAVRERSGYRRPHLVGKRFALGSLFMTAALFSGQAPVNLSEFAHKQRFGVRKDIGG